MELTLVTWNIHKGIGGVDRRYRPDRIEAVLSEYRPDFIFLQEVDEGARRSLFHRQVDLLGDALDLRHRCFSPVHRLPQGHYGNAILSRWPLSHIHHVDLSVGTRKRRGLIHVRTRVRVSGSARTMVLFNLHLGLAGSERRLQLERFLRSHPFQGLHHRTPIVVGGDFNDLWGTLGKRYLEPAGFRRAGKQVNTFPAALPVRPLDAIWLRGDLKPHHYGVGQSRLAQQASDHRPLVAKFSLLESAPPL